VKDIITRLLLIIIFSGQENKRARFSADEDNTAELDRVRRLLEYKEQEN